eukprot:1890184-Rhodomonas_salina.3
MKAFARSHSPREQTAKGLRCSWRAILPTSLRLGSRSRSETATCAPGERGEDEANPIASIGGSGESHKTMSFWYMYGIAVVLPVAQAFSSRA